jgi:hypothetical protein
MVRRAVALCVLAVLCGAAVVRAEVGGYLKQFAAATSSADSDQALEGAMSTRLRVHAYWRPSPGVSAEAAYGVSPRIQGAASAGDIATERVGGSAYRAVDVRERVYPGPGRDVGTCSLTQNIDRAWVEWSVGAADLTLGRQTIAFGSARVVNPTDMLAPFSYTALDKEERVGVDAVRARYALGAYSELDAGAVFGDDFRQDASAYYLRAQTYGQGMDASLVALRFRRHMLAGVDIARSVGGAGTWVEAAYTVPVDDAPDYARVSAGADYSPLPAVYAFGEYHFNTAGATAVDGYAALGSTPAYVDGASYLLGRRYAAVGLSAEAGPLAAAGVQVLVNLTDGSTLLAPTVEFSFAEDVYLSGGAFVSVLTGSDASTPREFAAYPDMLHGAIRLYF